MMQDAVRILKQCPACDGREVRAVIEMDRVRCARFLEFSQRKYGGLMDAWPDRMEIAIDRCLACGHHWYRVQPSETELLAMYGAGRPLVRKDGAVDRSPTEFMCKEMRRLHALTGRRGRLLDYGSGFGRWARAAVLEGYEVTAYEPAVARGEESGELPFTLVHDLVGLRGQHFDAINLEQVLEHVRDPFVVLQQVREICNPDSIVRLTVPNILRPPEGSDLWHTWPFDGKRVHTMAPFEHLHGFTIVSMICVAKRAGFRPVSMLGRIMTVDPAYNLRRLLGGAVCRLSQTKLYLAMG